MRILDKEYSTDQKYTQTPLTDFYTSAELLKMLYENYPFKIKVYLVSVDDAGNEQLTLYEGQDVQMPTSSRINIRIQIEWPYEMGSSNANATLEEADGEDTFWGQEAYKYHKDNPDEYSIVIKLDVKAIQKDGTGTP